MSYSAVFRTLFFGRSHRILGRRTEKGICPRDETADKGSGEVEPQRPTLSYGICKSPIPCGTNGTTEVNSINTGAISRNPDILGGTPVFSGTRVPIRILIEHLEAGDCLDDFLDSYPTVSRDQAIEVLETAKMALTGKTDETVV